MKRKGILTYATIRMDLERILSQSSSYNETNTVGFHSYEVLRGVKLLQTESRVVTAGAREGGIGRYGFSR